MALIIKVSFKFSEKSFYFLVCHRFRAHEVCQIKGTGCMHRCHITWSRNLFPWQQALMLHSDNIMPYIIDVDVVISGYHRPRSRRGGGGAFNLNQRA